jgi:hypothetical protein
VISFRFHLVSLVAVFLALGLGVLAGTTVLNQVLVTRLENQTEAFSRQNARLDEALNDMEDFQEQALPYLLEGRLQGQRAVLITQEGTDDQAIANVRSGLEDAGASVLALISVGSRLALPTEEDRAALAETLGVSDSDDPVELKRQAAEALATRLLVGPLENDLLAELIGQEFLLNRGPGLGEQGLEELSDADLVVVVGGGAEQPAPRPDTFLVPLVASLAQSEGDLVVAAAESVDSRYEFVTLLRGDPDTAAGIVTQDNVDQVAGEVGLVLALEDLMLFGEPGHYGEKDGASDLIPPADTG